MAYDVNLELVAPGSPVTLTADGYVGGAAVANKAIIHPSGRGRRVLHVKFSALDGTNPTARFYVGVSHNGAANFRWIACGPLITKAALGGGDATLSAAEIAAGRDPLTTMDTISAVAGKIEIPFDFDPGRQNCYVGLFIDISGTSPTVTIDAAWVTNSIV
jgi:hypothetical protein